MSCPGKFDAARLVRAGFRYLPWRQRWSRRRRLCAAGHQGRVVVAALLDASGKIEYTMVESSSGYPALVASAVIAVSSWKYTSGHRDMQPITCHVREPVTFSLAGK